MMDRLQVKKPLYPLVGVGASLLIFLGALLLARTMWGTMYVILAFLLLCVFGYGKTCIKVLPVIVIYVVVFSLIFYLCSRGDFIFVWQMANRLAGVGVAAVPGLALPPVNLVRALTQLHCPRLLSLGMMITISFIPVLTAEIRQVRNAMKTRGASSVLHPGMLYRAFLIPLFVRLINITDTLALSVETRGFVSEDNQATVFKTVKMQGRDWAFCVSLLIVFILILVCEITGKSF